MVPPLPVHFMPPDTLPHCCVPVALQATDGGQGWVRCNAHGQDAVAEVAQAVLPQIDPNLDQQWEDVLTYDSNINMHNQVLTTNTVPTPFPPLSPLQPCQPTPTSTPLQPTITSQPTESMLGPSIIGRSLAQPLDAEWATHCQAVQDERATIRTQKIQQHEMDERKKHTCLLVVYHTVSLSLSEPYFYRKISYFQSPEWFTTSTDWPLCWHLSMLPTHILTWSHLWSRTQWELLSRSLGWRMENHYSQIGDCCRERPAGTSLHLTQPSSNTWRLSRAWPWAKLATKAMVRANKAHSQACIGITTEDNPMSPKWERWVYHLFPGFQQWCWWTFSIMLTSAWCR